MTTDTSNLADKLWVELIKAGNSTAFTKIVEKYQRSINNLCYHMLGDSMEAEDATQEVFLRAYAKLDSYDENHKFSSWLFSIASHYCIDKLRPQRHHLVSWDDSPPVIIRPRKRFNRKKCYLKQKLLKRYIIYSEHCLRIIAGPLS